MAEEVIEVRNCTICNRFLSGSPEKFSNWIEITQPINLNSTDTKNYHCCNVCQLLIDECIKRYLESHHIKGK